VDRFNWLWVKQVQFLADSGHVFIHAFALLESLRRKVPSNSAIVVEPCQDTLRPDIVMDIDLSILVPKHKPVLFEKVTEEVSEARLVS
jgi:hypothetical protein